MDVAKEIELYFPTLHEFRKGGSLVSQMLDKGFDGAQVHYHHQAFGLGDLKVHPPFARNETLERMELYDRLKSEEELFVLLNHTRHYDSRKSHYEDKLLKLCFNKFRLHK